MLDLTPFGFTPTESHVYRTLLSLGPSSGYAVAKALSIARANAYQALDALVAKGAAERVDDTPPRRYRGIRPRTLFAAILEAEARKLDALEAQLSAGPEDGAAPLVQLEGERAVMDAAVRAIVRTDGPVRVLAQAQRLGPLGPALRARSAAGRPLEVLIVGEPEAGLPYSVSTIETERYAAVFTVETLIVLADGVLVARFGASVEAVWSESVVLSELTRASLNHLAS